jgi:WD40 repeat protein
MVHAGSIEGAAFSHDEGHVLTWSRDGTVRVWDSHTGKPVTAALKNQGPVLGATFNSDSTLILAWGGKGFGSSGTAELWKVDTGQHLSPPMMHQGMVRGATFSTDEQRILTWSNDGTTRIWMSSNGEPVTPPMEIDPAMKEDKSIAMNRLVKGARFSSDETKVLTWGGDSGGGGGGKARIWDAATGAPVTKPFDHVRIVDGAKFIHKEQKVLTWAYKTVHLWDISGDGQIKLEHDEEVNGAHISHDELRILTWSGSMHPGTSPRGAARLWDSRTGKLLTRPMWHETAVSRASFDRSEHRVLTWGRNGARVWESKSGLPLTPLLKQEFSLSGALLDEEGRRIITWGGVLMGNAGSARIWHLPSTDKAPQDRAVRQVERDSGTRLDSTGELEVLNQVTWQEVKKSLEANGRRADQ